MHSDWWLIFSPNLFLESSLLHKHISIVLEAKDDLQEIAYKQLLLKEMAIKV